MKKGYHKLLSVLIAIITVLPDYWRLFGQPIYQYFILLLSVLCTFERKTIKKRKIHFVEKTLLLMLCLYFIPRFVHLDFRSLIAIIIVPILFIYSVYVFVETEDDIHMLIESFLSVGLILSLFCIIEFIYETNVFSLLNNVELGIIDSTPQYRNNVIRIESSFGTAIACGIYYNFINILCLFRINSGYGNRKHIILYILSCICIILTQSRMPIITLLFSQVLCFRKSNKIIKLIAPCVLLVIFIGDLLTEQLILNAITKYATLISSVLLKNTNYYDVSVEYRKQLISVLLPVIEDKIIFGHGQTFMSNFSFRIWQFTYTSIDNNYLGVLLRYGCFGLLAQLWPFIIGAYYSIKNRKNELSFYIIIIIIVYLMNLLSVYEMSENRAFYYTIGITLSMFYMNKITNKQEATN